MDIRHRLYHVIVNKTKTTATLEHIKNLQKNHTNVICDVDWYIQNGGMTLGEYKDVFLSWIPHDWREFQKL